MRDVVIIGGGLTGLAAAAELAKTDLDVTLIEVKRYLGGSLRSVSKEGMTLDSGTMALAPTLDPAWLAELGLSDALFTLDSLSDTVGFVGGNQQLIDALRKRITATRLMRMAVSSIGEIEQGLFGVCLENGIMFDARALILAVPARYAERMFYGYLNPVAEALYDYSYDNLHRVSLVCPTDAMPARIINPPEMGYAFIHHTTNPRRVPENHTLIQFGLRIPPQNITHPEALIRGMCQQFRLPNPVASHISYWAEADPITCYDDQHPDHIVNIRAQLPERLALVGSDYTLIPPTQQGRLDLQPRIQQGIAASQQILASL